ncbi:hypothetical protein GCM10010195_13040 [Kitasatospora griseola]|nr:hypothetical protein [Kitasatospora griseola]GGQ58846.1 hypothetical protein GCM10010195_13040 [Kitasatospora griseola]
MAQPFAGLGGQTGREQGADGDGGGEGEGLTGDVDGPPGPPTGGERGRFGRHRLGVARQQGLPEGGLDDPAEPLVVGVRAGGEAVAEEGADLRVERAGAVEVGPVGEHPPDQLRCADQVQLARADPDPDQVAVRGQGVEEGERAGEHGREVAQQREAAGGGGGVHGPSIR